MSACEKFKSAAHGATYCFVVLTIVYQLLLLCFPFAFLNNVLHLSVFSQILAIVGLLLFIFNIAINRNIVPRRYTFPLLALIVSLGLSSLLLFDFGVIGNANESSIVANGKSIIWQIDQMLVLFPFFASLDKRELASVAKRIFVIVSAVFIPCILISFYQYFFSIGYDAIYGTAIGTRQGFQGGRLFGMMTGVFSAGLMSAVLSLVSVYFAFSSRSVFGKTAFSFVAICYFIYAVLSGTRSVFLALVVAVSLASFFLLYRRSRKTPYAKVFYSLAGSLFCGVVAFSLYGGVSLLMGQIPQWNADQKEHTFSADVDDSHTVVLYDLSDHEISDSEQKAVVVASYLDGSLMLSPVAGSNAPYNLDSLATLRDDPRATFFTLESNEDDSEIIVTRPDTDASSEASNGRFQIWSDYLSVLFSSPKNLLFGLSPGCYMPKIYEDYSSDGLYIVDYIKEHHPSMIKQGLIYDVHNGYLSAFVQGGLLACFFLAVFLWRLIGDAVRVFLRGHKTDFSLFCALCVLAFIMVAVFFDSDLFFRMTSTSVVFWAICGFLASEVRSSGFLDRTGRDKEMTDAPVVS